ncbi:putative bifunctional diguanylate cyclase/phosphodiesterase [Anaerotalea alkaliphila]|uniref:EAL domain-containing protein n=1 Tax=Anaerotalea alkaliphila TaxID=2662126 RepID=A0A7X5KMD5_9FIRM|nr:ABC transporter substrate binding protein [Anaerotalea alkaliphila]NDL67846.1 EAL domain-containing protein [Anaerotalea alkaliphila]
MSDSFRHGLPQKFSAFAMALALVTAAFFPGYVLAADVESLGMGGTGHRVLYISSYHGAFDTFPDQLAGLRSVFDGEDVVFDIEFMDTKRFDTRENYDNYYRFLKYRLDRSEPYDVVVVSDDNGLQFLMDNREDLLGDIPVVFFAINDMARVLEADGMEGFTGVYESSSIYENLALAKRLQPEATEFVAITDGTITGLGDARSFLQFEALFPEMEFTVVNFTEYALEDFKAFLRGLTGEQIVLYMTMFEDVDGNVYTIGESVDILVESASVPVYRHSIGGVGDGLLGGYMLSYFEQGRIAASMAMEVLRGVPADSIPVVTESPNMYVFDYNVMKAYGLDFDVLPQETEIVNAPTGFYDRYQHLLMPLMIALAVSLLIVGILVYDNRRRRIVELALREKNVELTQSRQKLQESEQRFRVLAYNDSLTGLKNRIAMSLSLGRLIEDGNRSGSLYFIDLDHFKYINDSCGHLKGDEVLRVVGERFKALEDDRTIATRLGGDEFVLIRHEEGMGHEVDNELVVSISKAVEEMILVEEQEFYLSCSIGIVKFPEHGNTANELIRKADIAMYQAKETGRSRAMRYSDFMESNASNILEIQNNIRHALDNEEFQLYLQPQAELAGGKVIGFEGLIRWELPGKGMVSPMEFIPVAEQLGIIHRISQWVFQEACRDILLFLEKHYKGVKIAVNVSAVELTRVNFVEDFMGTLGEYGISPANITIELTETVLLETSESHLERLDYLRSQGIELHLDDFGTGYSSLNYLRSLPIDVVKIDQGFIRNITVDKEQMHLTRSIIEIAHNLGKTVIAEGVETKEQMELLKELGCDRVQGYFFARPMTIADTLQFMEGHEMAE